MKSSLSISPPQLSFDCSPVDRQHIRDLISTLDNANLLTLGLKAPALIAIGSTLNHLHPFTFIHVAMSNSELREKIERIFKHSIKRTVFMNGNGITEGFKHRLDREKANKNLEPHLKKFSHSLHVQEKEIASFIQASAWNDMFLHLCQKMNKPSRQSSLE